MIFKTALVRERSIRAHFLIPLIVGTVFATPEASAQVKAPFVTPYIINSIVTGNATQSVAADALGNVYFTDNVNNTVNKLDPNTGKVSVYAGGATATCATATDGNGDGCLATQAKFSSPRQIAVTPAGDLLVADYGLSLIRIIDHSTQVISVIAGYYGGFGGDGGPATRAQLYAPGQIAMDAAGNLYIADTNNNRIRAVAAKNGPSSVSIAGVTIAAGNIATIAGGATVGATGDNGPAAQALLKSPTGIAVDANGNIFIADTGNAVVRAIYTAGSLPGITSPVAGDIYRIAGGGTNTNSKIPALQAQISNPWVVQLDMSGNLFIFDTGYSRVLRVTANTAILSVVAGGGGSCSTGGTNGDGCPAPNSQFSQERGGAFDALGNLLIADTGHSLIRRVNLNTQFAATAVGASLVNQVVVHFAPTDQPGSFSFDAGSKDFSNPGGRGCGLNSADNTYDCNYQITFQPTAPGVRTGAATLTSKLGASIRIGFSGVGQASSIAIDPGSVTTLPAAVGGPSGIASDNVGNLYIADTANNRILYYNAASQTTSVLAGTGSAGYTGDGASATAATLNAPRAIALDSLDNIYIADTGNHAIRKIDGETGNINTLAGTGQAGNGGDGGQAALATLNAPAGILADRFSNVYVADTGNNVIRLISSGVIHTVAGGATSPCGSSTDAFGDGCTATQAVLKSPAGLAFDANDNLLVADSGDNLVRSISGGVITAVAGTGVAGFNGDGISAIQSELKAPLAVSTDAAGALYILDSGNALVRRVDSFGVISTVAGQPSGTASANATAANQIQLTAPAGIAVTGNGNFYVADTGVSRLLGINRSQAALTFSGVNVGQTSPSQNASLTNAGNLQAVLTTPLFQATGSSSTFSVQPSATNGCNAGGTIIDGSECNLAVTFTPAASGAVQASLTFGSNSPLGSSQLSLSGTGASLISTSLALNVSGGSTTVPYLAPVTVVASITATGSQQAPTGTVIFSVDGQAQPAVTVASGMANITLSGLTIGQHQITASYSGNSVFASTSSAAPLAVAVSQSMATVGLAISTTSAVVNQNVTFTATFAVAAGSPTGTVTFNNGTVALGSAPVGTNGTAAFSTTALALGTYRVVAVYSGDANFASASSSEIDLTVGLVPTVLSLDSFASGNPGIVVAADGSGDYKTVQSAVSSLPVTGGIIYIKPGTYTEVVKVTQPNVQLRGLGTDPSQVIITFNNSHGTSNGSGGMLGTSGSSTFKTTGDYFYAENITFQNTYDLENNQDNPNSQAVALYTTGDHAIFNNDRFISRQDTLYAGESCVSATNCIASRQYFYNSYIEGNVDYIFGNSQAVFDHCTIHSVYHDNAAGEATITAQNKSYAGQASGYVFVNSLFTSEADAGPQTELFLGRPYGTMSTVVLVNNNLQSNINSAGWIEFSPGVTNSLPTSDYAEYNSAGPGATGPREQYAVALTQAQAAGYAPATYLAGADHWDPTNVYTMGANQSLTYTSVVIDANNAAVPTGTVTLSVDSSAYAPVALVNGAATQTVTGLTGGAHTVQTTYSGDANSQSSASQTITVNVTGGAVQQQTTTVLSSSASIAPPGTTVTLTATVAGPANSATPSGSVTFLNGTAPIGTVSLSNGIATLVATLPATAGPVSYSATYAGQGLFLSSTSNTTTVTAGLVPTTVNTESVVLVTNTVTVAADGSGNYTTVQAAVNSLPSTGGVIYVKPGTYKEVVTVGQDNVQIIGLGTDPSQVVITYNNAHGTLNSQGGMLGTGGSATFTTTGANFYAENVTFQNTYDIENNQDNPNSQAVALYTQGDRAVFSNDRFIGRQDTLYTGERCDANGLNCMAARQYFVNSYIEGNVDYIFGNSQAVFENDTINTVYHDGPTGETTITAQNKAYSAQPSGYVFINSLFTAQSDQGPETKLYLGRPWGTNSSVVLIGNNLQAPVAAAGWIEFTPGTTNNLPSSYYAEYGSTGPGATGPREQYAIALTAAQVPQYATTAYLAGSDNWDPTSAHTSTAGQTLHYMVAVAPQSGIGVPTGTVTFLGVPTGTVTFLVDGQTQAPVTLTNGRGSQDITGLVAGTHTVQIAYSGDASFGSSTSASLTVHVNPPAPQPTTTMLTSSAPNITAGGSITLTAQVAVTGSTVIPTGTVAFSSGTTSLGSAPLNASGIATLAITTLPVGSDAITATYVPATGSVLLASTSTAVTVAVAAPATTTTLTSSAPSITAGGSITLTAQVAVTGSTVIPTGTVAFSSGTTSLGSAPLNASGIATLAITTLPVGSDAITATYVPATGSVLLASTSTAVTVAVAAPATTTTLTSSAPSITAGGSITLTAQVAVTGSTVIPTGTVAFSSGTTSLGSAPLNASGIATLAITTLPVGSDAITATYVPATGSVLLASTSTAVTVAVAAPATTTTLTSSAPSITAGGSITLTAQVAVTGSTVIPTGTVAFSSGTTNLGSAPLNASGIATLATTALPIGGDAITATYVPTAGSTFLASSSSAATVVVTAPATTITLTSSASNITTGASVTFTARVVVAGSSTIPTGSVTFSSGTTNLGSAPLNGSGVASLATTALPIGSDAITATYLPTAGSTFLASTSSAATVVVTAPATTTTLTSSASNITTGASVTFTARVAVAGSATIPTGSVTFSSGTTNLGSAPLNGSGVASLATTALSIGSDAITATYAPTAGSTFLASTSSAATVVVTAPSALTTTLTASATSIAPGTNVTLTALVVNTGKTTPTGSVSFYSGSTKLGAASLSSKGVASITASNLTNGVDSITAIYVSSNGLGSSTSTPVTVTVATLATNTALTASATSIIPKANITLIAHVTVPGATNVPKGSVTFYSGSMALGSNSLDSKGNAVLTTSKLPAGSDSITGVFAPSSGYTASTSTPVTVLVAKATTTVSLTASATTIKKGNKVTLTVKVNSTPAALLGGSVLFYVNGKQYEGASVDNSVAVLKTEGLPIGLDSIVAVYSGDSGSTGSTSSAVVIQVTK